MSGLLALPTLYLQSHRLVADPLSSVGGILARARHCVTHEFKITHVTIQIEPPGWHCDGPHL